MSNIELHAGSPVFSSLDEQMRYAQALAEAGLVPDSFRQKPPNVLVAIEIARTLNESPYTVMSEMAVISGRPSFSAKFMRSRVRQAGHKLRETFESGVATAVVIRSDDPDFEHSAKWDEAKARQHGYWGKGHWGKNPELMLKNRALSEVVREACYEVMGGIAYTPDEVMDFAPQQGQSATGAVKASARSPRDAAMQALNTAPQAKRTLDDDQVAATLEWVEGATDVAKLRAKHDGAAALVDDQREWIQQLINARIDELTGDDTAVDAPEVDAEVEPDTAA